MLLTILQSPSQSTVSSVDREPRTDPVAAGKTMVVKQPEVVKEPTRSKTVALSQPTRISDERAKRVPRQDPNVNVGEIFIDFRVFENLKNIEFSDSCL